MRAVLNNLVRLGGMQFVLALTAVVRNKALAYRLGAEGFGEFSQLAVLVIFGSTFVALGLGMSLNRNTAATPDAGLRQRFLAQANAVNLVGSVLVLSIGLAIALLRPEFLEAAGLPAVEGIRLSFAIMLAFIPLEVAMQHRIGFLTGMVDVQGLSASRSMALLIGTAASLPLIWFFGLVGAAAQFVLLSALNVLLLDRRCRFLGIRPWRVVWDRGALKILAGLGVASVAAGMLHQLSDTLNRIFLMRWTDATQNGLYQAAVSITYQVKAVVLGSVGSYAVATLSQDASSTRMSEVANQLLRLVLPIAAIALGLLGLFSGLAILVLYSPDFLGAQQILPMLLAAEFLNVIAWVCGAPLLAEKRVAAWLFLEVLYATTKLAVSLPLIAGTGATGLAAGYLIATAAHAFWTVLFYRRSVGLTIERANSLLMLLGVATVVFLGRLGENAVVDWARWSIGAATVTVFLLVAVRATMTYAEAAHLAHTMFTKIRKR